MHEITRRIVHRKDLYHLVWKKPLVKLAEEFSVSDVMLGKICRKLRVPTPPVGYWAKLAAGHKLKKPPLPKVEKNHPVTHLFAIKNDSEDSKRIRKEANIPQELQEIIAFENNKLNKIIVTNERRRLHHLTTIIRKDLESNQVDRYGRIYSYKLKGIVVGVSLTQVKRALTIVDILIKALENRGYLHIDTEKGSVQAYIEILDNKMDIVIYEPAKQIEHTPSKKPKELYWSHKYDFIPRGKLQLQVKKHGYDYVQKSWSDTDVTKLENKLNLLIIGLAKVSLALTEERIRWERWRHEQEELQRKKEEAIRQEELRRKQEEELLSQAKMWKNYRMLKEFITVVKSDLESKRVPKENRANIEKWIVWATKKMELLDPRKNLYEKEDTDLDRS